MGTARWKYKGYVYCDQCVELHPVTRAQERALENSQWNHCVLEEPIGEGRARMVA